MFIYTHIIISIRLSNHSKLIIVFKNLLHFVPANNFISYVLHKRDTNPKISDPSGIWTQDLLITSPMFYQLSYRSQVEEEHFIDNVYYLGKSWVSLLKLLHWSTIPNNCHVQYVPSEFLSRSTGKPNLSELGTCTATVVGTSLHAIQIASNMKYMYTTY